ncbi:MAG: hypothetical protein FWE95_07800 [Planctomycetaceae bacterium]|nr:hypothetical protein [Planctomycetaceae bacterium]
MGYHKNQTTKTKTTSVRTPSKGNVRRPAKYLHLVNLGTKQGAPALHFIEKTQEQLADQVRQIIANAVQEALR